MATPARGRTERGEPGFLGSVLGMTGAVTVSSLGQLKASLFVCTHCTRWYLSCTHITC